MIAADEPLDPNAFVVGTAAQDAGGCIIYNNVTSDIFYDANSTASRGLTRFAHIAVGTTLSAASFIEAN